MTLSIQVWSELTPVERRRALTRPTREVAGRVERDVAAIIRRVREEGDAAVRAITLELDGAALEAIEVEEAALEAAERVAGAEELGALQQAAANIARFHAAQMPQPLAVETAPGVACERLTRPIGAVGLYVPAGSAPLPSTALMLGVPAALAGCPLRILCTPPRADGSADPLVLLAARLAGVQRVFRIGGAQAIAAMAYGTATVPRVDKLFGPGNRWVTAAKLAVARDPGGPACDMPAGPSEVLVIADDTARPEFVAADLLSQAEHGVDSQVVFVSLSQSIATRTLRCVDEQLQGLGRAAIAREALGRSRAFVVDGPAEALELSNAYAPEHLILQVREPRAFLEGVENAGSVFLGAWAPEAIGDYCSGTNHVLPTDGHARTRGGLGIGDFLKHITVQELTPEGLAGLGPVARTLAQLEGLDGHARAIAVRQEALAEQVLK